MVAIIDLFNNSIISFVWEQKFIILGGVFLGISIFSYFYKVGIEKKRQELIINKIKKIMSDQEKYEIKEVVNDLRGDFRNFKAEVRNEFKEIYVLIADLKKDTSLNSLRITMYVSIAVFIIGSVLNVVIK